MTADPAKVLDTLSVLAFAKRLGVDEKSVRKSIRNGRLQQSIGQDAKGRAVIVNVALAEQEWERNRDTAKVRAPSALTIAEEKRRLVRAQARKVELANREKSGGLVSRRAVEIRYSTRVVTARTKLLGIPSRAKQRIPHLDPDDLVILDELIREALEELAGDAHAPD